jgi:heme exporter protein A
MILASRGGCGEAYNLHVLAVNGLGKRYGDRWLFRNLTFTLNRGDALIVLGRNGAGKSTLLKALAGLLVPSEGKIEVDVPDTRTGLSLSALEMSLYPSLTLREHLRLAADLRACEAREDELLTRIGLTHAAALAASKISTGMKARLKLALAIQPNPSVLILDEPGAGMDDAGKELVQAICEEQIARGVLILATNDQREKALGTLELELIN